MPNQGETMCECSEEYGPCQEHGEVIVSREGASTRTADDLLYVFLCDAVDVIEDATDENILSPWGKGVIERAGAMLEAEDHYGCRWLPEREEGEGMRDEMHTLQSQLETELATLDDGPYFTYWDDGYRIVRVLEGCPLIEE